MDRLLAKFIGHGQGEKRGEDSGHRFQQFRLLWLATACNLRLLTSQLCLLVGLPKKLGEKQKSCPFNRGLINVSKWASEAFHGRSK